MQPPPRHPHVADRAPDDDALTPYDHDHLITYLRLLDAEADGADWREVASLVLTLDPEADQTHAIWQSHLARAQWMMRSGYRHLLDR